MAGWSRRSSAAGRRHPRAPPGRQRPDIEDPRRWTERKTVSSENAIEVVELTKKFGDFTAVDEISFAVSKAEIFGFLGPNGAGKTTTISMLCTLLRPPAGRAFIGGHHVERE